MKKYKSHKIVTAAKILTVLVDGASFQVVCEGGMRRSMPLDHPMIARFRPSASDYLVRYESGYEAFSPRFEFENGYAEVPAARSQYTATAGENTPESLLAEMEASGATGWAFRMRELLGPPKQATALPMLTVFQGMDVTGIAPEHICLVNQVPELADGANGVEIDVQRCTADGKNILPERLAVGREWLEKHSPQPGDLLIDRPRFPIAHLSRGKKLDLVKSVASAALPEIDIAARVHATLGEMLPTKVTREEVLASIKSVTYEVRPDGRSTMCEVTLHNGWPERGWSAAVSVEEFNKGLGERYAYEDALRKVWEKQGFLLRERRFNAGLK